MFFGPLGILGSNVNELEAIKHAIVCFSEAGWIRKSNLIIESDSKISVSWVLNHEAKPWKLWPIFVEIDRYWKNIGNVSLINVFRECNSFADLLAKKGVTHPSFFKAWW